MAKSLQRDWDAVEDAIVRTANSLARDVGNRLTSIEYRDDRPTVDRKLGHQMEVARLASFIREQIDKRVLPNVATQTQLTTPYRLPAFDADGNRAGSTFLITPEPRASAISIDLPYFRFQLGDWFDNAVDWMDEKVGWIVGGSEASDQRRAQRLQERWEHIAEVFSSEWCRHVGTSLVQVNQETVRQYQTLYDAIESVFRRIEHHAGGSVSGALGRIQVALTNMAVPPVFQAQMLTSLSSMQSGRLKNCGRRSVAMTAGSVERALTRSTQRPMSGSGKTSVDSDLRHSPSAPSSHGGAKQRHSSTGLNIGERLVHKKLGRGEFLGMDRKYYIVQFDSEESPRKFNESIIFDPNWFSRGG